MTTGSPNDSNGPAKDAPVPSPAPSDDRIVEEGMMIALSAVRMAVKNLIIVGALRAHSDYDPAEYAALARDELHELARQNDEDSTRVARLGRHFTRSPTMRTKTETENRRRDVIRLGRRRTLHDRVAERLRALADDDDQVDRLVAQARDDAGAEINAALAARLIDQAVDHRAPDYATGKDDRLQALVSTDLAALAKRQGRNTRR